MAQDDLSAQQKDNAAATIGSMSRADLQKFVQMAISQSPANLPNSLTGTVLTATDHLVVQNKLHLSPQAITYLKSVLGLP
jgi:hypothetical protein